ncbi:MAG TPA: ECF transporter S component [bacterium]|nr:ECF transporter S component [bacterium]
MSTRQIASVAVFIALYAVIGQVIRFIPNPMVPGAIIALNMTVVVIAGILLGPVAGLLVGALGSLLDGVIRGSAFQLWAIGPHAVMGLAAGLLARLNPTVAALAIIVGHALNIVVYLLVGLLPASQVAVAIFWTGLLVETIIDLVVIWLAVALLRPLMRTASTA